VQCGLCKATCPEKVIALDPRVNFTGSAVQPRLIKEEEPFHCIRCAKPFGTKSTIERIASQLEGKHWMYNKDTIERVRMCGDCRVIVQSQSKIDPYAGAPRPDVRCPHHRRLSGRARRRRAEGEREETVMKVLGIAGWSGAGKTTLLADLIPMLVARGVKVSTIKHAHHDFDIDQPGKDSYRHRQAGASEVLISSANRFALMRELRGAPEPSLEELISRLSPVDLVLVEGFKKSAHPKIEVWRKSVGKAMLQPDDASIIAVASDAPIADLAVPQLDANRPAQIVDFILAWLSGKTIEARRGAAE
jgi:molybdopterin-guanine dinucleotide biosynthesis adapter protein